MDDNVDETTLRASDLCLNKRNFPFFVRTIQIIRTHIALMG